MENILKDEDQVDRWEETMFLYESALKQMTMKAEMLNDEFVCGTGTIPLSTSNPD